MQSYQTLAARPRQSLTSSSGRLAQTVDEIAAARNCGRSLGFQAGQALYSHLVSDFHFFETRHSAAMGRFKEASLSAGENEKLRRRPASGLISDLIVVSWKCHLPWLLDLPL
jgi:hypothetical protein